MIWIDSEVSVLIPSLEGIPKGKNWVLNLPVLLEQDLPDFHVI